MQRLAITVLMASLLITGCSGASHRSEPAPTQQPVPNQQAPAQAAQQPSELPRDSAREISGYVRGTLVAAGYRCNEDSVQFLCMHDTDDWVASVATVVENDRAYLLFDSYATRTPWISCAEQRQRIQSVGSDAAMFRADCNDSSQRLRFNTSLVYDPRLQIPEWFSQHIQSRYDAFNAFGGLTYVEP